MSNPKCMYKKEYTLLSNWNTLLQNPGPILEYVADKVDELIKKYKKILVYLKKYYIII